MKEFIHSLTKLKAHNAQKFALGLESGLVKVYSFDEKTGDISLYLDIKEHTKAITYLLGLNNGNLLTCSIDKDIKIINIPKAFFKNYSVVQTIKCAADSFYFQSAIEMTDGNLIAGDWKNITIWQPTKKSGSNDCEYTELNKIVINNRVNSAVRSGRLCAGAGGVPALVQRGAEKQLYPGGDQSDPPQPGAGGGGGDPASDPGGLFEFERRYPGARGPDRHRGHGAQYFDYNRRMKHGSERGNPPADPTAE